MKKYSQLTDHDRHDIIGSFRGALDMGATDCKHAAAIAAHWFFKMTDRQWNSKTGTDAYATVLAVVVHRDVVTLTKNYV